MKTGIKVGDAMTTKPITIGKNESIQSAAKTMEAADVNSILVEEDDKVIGIVTEFDLARKVIAKGMDYREPVKDIMENILLTVEPHMDLFYAMQQMRDNDIRHLPVVDEGEFKGLITMKDILKIEPQLFELVIDKMRAEREERDLYSD